MIINWTHLLLSLLLLWFPRQWLRFGGNLTKRRSHRSSAAAKGPERLPGDQTVRLAQEIRKVRNYVDLLRAIAGGIALIGIPEAIDPAMQALTDAPPETVQLVMLLPLAIVLVAVLIQSFRLEGRTRLFPPIFYLMGLTLALCGLSAGLFAIVLVWTVNLALPSPTALLSVFGLLVMGFGLLFNGFHVLAAFAGGVVFVPVLLSLLMRRPLVLFSKKIKPSGPVSAA